MLHKNLKILLIKLFKEIFQNKKHIYLKNQTNIKKLKEKWCINTTSIKGSKIIINIKY